jgi:hypothetical protein
MVNGLLMELDDHNCQPVAEALGHRGPHRLQHLLSRAVWDDQHLVDIASARAAGQLDDGDAVLIVDETADEKSSADCAGAARQYSGTAGGVALCRVAVTLTYASGRGHALIGRALYLPEGCAADEEHRELAGVPEEVLFATKPQLAGDLLDRAHGRGIRAAFVAGDEVYGGRELRRSIRQRGMGYVLAVPANHVVNTGSGRAVTAAAATSLIPARAWHRMRTGSGTKGTRHYDWAMLQGASDDTPEGHGDGHSVLLARRHRHTGQLSYPTLIKLVRPWAGVIDLGQGCPEVVGYGVGGGDGVGAGLDGDGAVAAGGADEFPDAPAGDGLDPVADGQGGEHDGQVRFDGVALAVVDRPGLQVALCHPERFFGTEQPAVGVDHDFGRDRGAVGAGLQVGDVSLQPCQGPGLGFQSPVHASGPAGEGDEPVPLYWRSAEDGFFGLGDLLVDAPQGPPGPVGLVLVVDDLVTPPARGAGRPGLGEDVPVRDLLAGVLAAPLGHDVGDVADPGPEDERQAGVLDRLLVARRDHPRVGDHGHIR